jgi:uncharacterized membrane protein
MVCATCGAQMPDNAGFCPACGQAASQMGAAPETAAAEMQAVPDLAMHSEMPTPPAAAGNLQERLMAVLAYFTFIPALVLLLVEPHNRNRYIRFHALQCIFLSVVLVVLFGISLLLFVTPLPGHLFWLLICLVLFIGFFIMWLVLLVKAFQGEVFKLPVIGEWAERRGNLV